MIEITSKHLYSIYKELDSMSKSITSVEGTFELSTWQFLTDKPKQVPDPISLKFIRVDGEWKPTTDLIIKA